MNARELFVILLRVLGLFCLIWAIEGIPEAVGRLGVFFWTSSEGAQPGWYVLWTFCEVVTPVVRAIAGLLLLLSAPRFWSWFHPETRGEPQPCEASSVGPGEVYRIASFLLGAFVLILGVPTAARAVVMLMAEVYYDRFQLLADFVTGCVYLLFGLGFMFGASGIAQFLKNLDYDPENVPARQLSLRVLMFVILGVSLILGLIRYFVG